MIEVLAGFALGIVLQHLLGLPLLWNVVICFAVAAIHLVIVKTRRRK